MGSGPALDQGGSAAMRLVRGGLRYGQWAPSGPGWECSHEVGSGSGFGPLCFVLILCAHIMQ